MIFAVLKSKILAKSWYVPKIKMNLINSIILVYFLATRLEEKNYETKTQVTRIFLSWDEDFHKATNGRESHRSCDISLSNRKSGFVEYRTLSKVLLQ